MTKHPLNRAQRRAIRKIKSEQKKEAREVRVKRKLQREREKDQETKDAVRQWERAPEPELINL